MSYKDNVEKRKKKIMIEVCDIDKSFEIKKGDGSSSLKAVFTKPWDIFKSQKSKFDALSDISFKVESGDFIGIIGRNGSGKSTLLKVLAGIYSPDKGEVKINGKMVPFLELGVGFNPELSARENIFLNGTILGMSKRYLDKKLNEIVSFAEVKKFINTPVKNFSSGMMLKLAFAIAVQSDAEIFLLDEILAVGDAVFQRKSAKIIQKFIRQGKTILYVSHNLTSVENYANKVLWLHNGRMRFWGDSQEGVKKYLNYTFRLEQREIKKRLAQEAKKQKKENASKAKLNTNKDNVKKEEGKKDQSNLNRFGNYKVVARRVDVEILKNGDILFTAFLKHNKKIKDLNVAFGIYNTLNQNVFGISTQMDKIKIALNSTKVSLLIKSPNLLAGQYYVNIAVFGKIEARPYHWEKEVATFLISKSKNINPKYRGIVYFEHKWN